jgi:NADPH-dependent 2,4-dienoyl-CoA reductase/sulfur reductase-like enzyme
MGALIVGASLAGLRLAEQLRGCGYTGPIAIVGDERHKPYNRPPLSKDVLTGGAADADDAAKLLAELTFKPRPSLADVTWLLGAPAVKSDLERRVVTLADGRELPFCGLGIATGLSPRRLPFAGGEDNRHVVRTIDDAVRLRRDLTPGARLVVVGAGFIGCEVAASAVKRGASVTVVEPLSGPMIRAIGPELSQALQAYHEAKGVRFRLGVSLAELRARASAPRQLDAVALTDGTELPADVLVEAIGSIANVAWLEGNGLDLSDGVLTDNALRAGERSEVVATGDIARFPNPRYDDVPRRVEHWTIPGFTARRAAGSLAATLLGKEPDGAVFDPIPTFWSDQHAIRIQSAGMTVLGESRTVLEGSLAAIGAPSSEGLAIGYERGGKLAGVVTIGLPPARLSHYRSLLG